MDMLTTPQVAAMWGVSAPTARKILKDAPGVIRIKTQQKVSLRIPAAVEREIRLRLAAEC